MFNPIKIQMKHLFTLSTSYRQPKVFNRKYVPNSVGHTHHIRGETLNLV